MIRPPQLWRNFSDPSSRTLVIHLHRAALRGNREEVRQVLNSGVPVQSKTEEHGNSTIHLATMNSEHDYEVIELLIAKGADVNVTNRFGKTPLHLALEADKCNLKVIKLLLDSGADVERTDVSKCSPLHFAVKNSTCEVEVMNLLLERGANIDVENRFGDTPLLSALRNPSCTVGVVAWLLKHGANINAANHFGSTALHSAVKNRNFNLGVLKLLLKKKVPVNVDNWCRKSPLYQAIKNRCNTSIVQALLDAGAEIDEGPTFKMAVETCDINSADERVNNNSMTNLEMLVRYDTLKRFNFNIDSYIKQSKFFLSLYNFIKSCRRDALKMQSRQIRPGVNLRDFLAGQNRLKFNPSTTEGELYDLNLIFHFLALDQYPMYTSFIAAKLDVHDVCDNMRLYWKDSKPESTTIWLDSHATAYIVRYLNKDHMYNALIAFHSAEVCSECLG